MSLASTDDTPVTTRVNLLRALKPQEGYPRFRLPISVNDVRYDLVLSSAVNDWLNVCCTGDERQELDDPALGTPAQLRAALLQGTATGPSRDRSLYGRLELETVAHVHADRLCEVAEYRYLFVSQGMARQLCRDAEASDRLPPDLSEYVLLHRSVFTKCGGFELLAMYCEAVNASTFVRRAGMSQHSSTSEIGEASERRAFLSSLL